MYVCLHVVGFLQFLAMNSVPYTHCIMFLYTNLENWQCEASVTVDNISASWTYDAANTILNGVTFAVTKVLYGLILNIGGGLIWRIGLLECLAGITVGGVASP